MKTTNTDHLFVRKYNRMGVRCAIGWKRRKCSRKGKERKRDSFVEKYELDVSKLFSLWKILF